MIHWAKLLIRTAELDPKILNNWSWKIPAAYHPIVMSIFGDWFFADPLQRIFRFDLATGNMTRIAENLKIFQRSMYCQEELEAWFHKGLAYECHEMGLRVGEGCCLGFKVLPILGGELKVSNAIPVSLRVYQSMQSDVHRQLLRHSLASSAGEPAFEPILDITLPTLDPESATKGSFKRRTVRKWRHRRF